MHSGEYIILLNIFTAVYSGYILLRSEYPVSPFAKWLSIKWGAIDYPKDRGVHKKAMPRMGGIAIVLGFVLTVLISAAVKATAVVLPVIMQSTIRLNAAIEETPAASPSLMVYHYDKSMNGRQLAGFLTGALLIAGLGMLDDMYHP